MEKIVVYLQKLVNYTILAHFRVCIVVIVVVWELVVTIIREIKIQPIYLFKLCTSEFIQLKILL